MLSNHEIANSMTIVFDLLQKSGNKTMVNELSSFLMLAVYLSFRMMYHTDPKNPQGMFELPEAMAPGYSMAAMQKALTHAACVIRGECARSDALEDGQRLPMTPEVLKTQYPFFYQSLFNLIQRAEGLLK